MNLNECGDNWNPIHYRQNYYVLTSNSVDQAVLYGLSAPIGTKGMKDGAYHYPAWTEQQQANARARLGIEKEWTLKGTLTTDIKATGVNVDLSGCTEILFKGEVTGTGSSNLIGNDGTVTFIGGLVGNGYKKFLANFVDTEFGIVTINAKYSNVQTNNILSMALSSGTSLDRHLSDVEWIRFHNHSAVTECNIEIYAR